jgi:hypothetical protein
MSERPDLILDYEKFFSNLVNEACEQRNFSTFPQATTYLVDLLVFYVNTTNLFDEKDTQGRHSRGTLAELLLKAGNAQRNQKIGLLKKLGDTALYVSGFFGESLQRKIVNIDYYKEMGETAYSSLASYVQEDMVARIYREYSKNFIQFVDILTYISSRAIRPSDNLLQLFENYASGSDFAREELLNKGVIAVPPKKNRYSQ